MKLSILILTFGMACSSDISKSYKAPSLFLNHGGGPLPVLGEKYNKEIGDFLRNVSKYIEFDRTEAVIVVTAHREEDVVTISSGERHGMVYDYNNFPAVSYEWKHKAPGAPNLARSVHAAFTRAGIPATLDPHRGWDHGTFIPMMLADPAARIPILQISILKNQNASQHFQLGRVLRQFRDQGVAVIGSGMSYHNMAEFRKADIYSDGVIANEEFDEYLTDVCTGDDLKRILRWEEERGAKEAHPEGEADHLMPLIVNIGAAGLATGRKVFDSVFIGKFKLSGFVWN
ncbi:uncharacterized protein LOC134805959 [Cydia splendana]|uniref:uncharacterized protein LOC134805959 n=1 Tax=Cydia splendana TaxID=1100963 RepID=UPI00300D4B5B